MSIKTIIENIKSKGLLQAMGLLDQLYQKAIENEEKLAAAEAKCAALAAENAGLKQSTPDLQTMMSALDAFFADEDVPERAMLEAYNILRGVVPTPATDAFLAEVRNEAGARAVELFAQTLGSPYAVRDEKCYEDGFTRAIEIVRGAQAPRFAAQLRKGASA